MNTTDEYCILCGQEGPLRREEKVTEFDVRGETLHIEVPMIVCPSCGVAETARGADPAKIAFVEYRKRQQLLTPEQIKETRKRYRLSQKSFATLLGMSEATINRYERGGLQDEVHDHAIRACENPAVMRDLLERRGDRLSDWQLKRVQAILTGNPKPQGRIALGRFENMPKERTLQTGFREFDYLRYVAVVLWLCRHLQLVTATSLNKLLFYADFLHYKSEALSLTGSAYRRLRHGPVPAAYGDIQQIMELEGFIEAEEVQYRNGRTGMEFRVGPKADEIDVPFSTRERMVLEAVTAAFRNVTPGEIRDRSHKESAWENTEDLMLISYSEAENLSLPVPE